jgi:hypothetical protein
MNNAKPHFKYGSDAWVKKVVNNPAIDNERLSQMATELSRCGHFRALCQIQKEIRLRIELKSK